MGDPLILAALAIATVAACAATIALLRSRGAAPLESTSLVQAQRVEDQLQSVVAGLARVGAAQAQIDALRRPMDELLAVFQNKQARGKYGEARLESLVSDALPNDLYAFQVTLTNGKIADCVIGRGAPSNRICVDSKFPLEAYQQLNAGGGADAAARFRIAVKEHIHAISSKYIINGETSRLAVMFIPSESIYAELFTSFPELEEEANRRHVVFASPNTLHGLLATVNMFHVESKIGEHAQAIQREVGVLTRDVELLGERVEKLGRHFRQVTEDIADTQTSVGRIVAKGQRIKSVDLSGESSREISEG